MKHSYKFIVFLWSLSLFCPNIALSAGSDEVAQKNVDLEKFTAKGSKQPSVYGMWVWDQTLLGDHTRLQEMVQLCLDAGINEISFSINWTQVFENHPHNLAYQNPGKQGYVQEMLTILHKNNIRVELLLGDASWIYHEDITAPAGGIAFQYGRAAIERFIKYQNTEFQKAMAAADANIDDVNTVDCVTCFDGVRLDIEPHNLRPTVTYKDLQPEDPRRKDNPEISADDNDVFVKGYEVPAVPLFNDGQGYEGPLHYVTWQYLPDYDLDPGSPYADIGYYGFKPTPVSVRTEILKRYWVALKKLKSQLQDPRSNDPRHITNNPAAVKRYLSMAADFVPWLWTLGAEDEANFPERNPNYAFSLMGQPILTTNDPKNALVNDPLKQDKPLYQALLDIPDRVGTMGYRDTWHAVANKDVNGDGTIDAADIIWYRSYEHWNAGHPILKNKDIGPVGILPYLRSINKPVGLGLEFIDGEALGEGPNVSRITLADDSFEQAIEIIDGIFNRMKKDYPNIEGVRYHEYFAPKLGISSRAGPKFKAFKDWFEVHVLGSGNEDNLASWQRYHNVDIKRTAQGFTISQLPVDYDTTYDDPKAIDFEHLNLKFDIPKDFTPQHGDRGRLKATIVEGDTPIGDIATIQHGDFYVRVYLKIIGDTHYLQGGYGYSRNLYKQDGNGGSVLDLHKGENGIVGADGSFIAGPISLPRSDVWYVWWVNLFDRNGHLLRRFSLNPMTICEDPNAKSDCKHRENLPFDRFFILNDDAEISVAEIMTSVK